MLKKIFLLSVGVGLSLTSSASAQHSFPTVHAVGRFFGVGWSHGYQSGSQDNRFQSIKANHPAEMYASNALLYPFHPSYSAQTMTHPMYSDGHQYPGQHSSYQLITPGNSFPVQSSAGGSMQSQQSVAVSQTAPTVAPPVPAEPAPTWLRPFLKDEKQSNEEQPVELGPAKQDEELVPAEESPSDRAKAKADDDDLLIPSARLTPMQRYYEARQKSAAKR